MGIELVEGRDLEVDDDVVWMRTIDGRVRVDVIYRRIDDAFLDPLVFSTDSMLGVPGLMAAYRAGNVTLVNAPGTGIADDKAIYSYMPEIVRYYTGEEARLPNVETWRCREPEALEYMLDNLDKLVVKLVDGSGGYGMLVGPTASEGGDRGVPRRAEGRAAALHRPADAGAVDRADLHRKGLAPRHVDFRPFVLTGADGVTIVPGGLTRVALRKGSLVVNSSQGGGTKDSFVLAARAEEAPDALPHRLQPLLDRPLHGAGRVHRPAGRGDDPARRAGRPRPWRAGLASALARGRRAAASATGEERLCVAPPLSYAEPTDNPGSIRSCLARARDNARAARTALTVEVWEAINRAWLIIRDRASPGGAQATLNLVEELKAETRGFEGALARMLRSEGCWFMRLGSVIERGDNTARLLDVKYYLLLPPGQEVGGALDRDQWTTILQIVSARTAYRHIYREALKPWLVADFLIFRREMPRSLAGRRRRRSTCSAISPAAPAARARPTGSPASASPGSRSSTSARSSSAACTNGCRPISPTTPRSTRRSPASSGSPDAALRSITPPRYGYSRAGAAA